MTPSEVSTRLADRAHDVCRLLLPNGKRDGKEWRVGSVNGEAGASMGVCLTGEKAGIWCDFASGESGDLLDLWCLTHSCDMRAALTEAKEYLGVREPEFVKAPERSYTRPERPKCSKPKATSPVMEYLKGRGLSEATIQAFKIGEEGRDIVFPFLRNGALIHWKKLSIDRPNGKKKITAAAGSEPCLFGWQAMDPHVREVTITEGEIDAMTAHQYGRPALSVPMGGGVGAKQGWIEYEYENLQRFDVIWLALDQDEEGQKATEEIIKRLGRERCRIVELPGKDFNACLDALLLSPEDIAECYAKAKTLDPDKLRDAAGYLADVESAFFDREANQVGMELPWEKSRDHIRFRSSELTVWTGFSGHGKSQLLGYLALHGMAKGHRFCIASMEMPAVRTLQRMVRQAAGVGYPTRGFLRHVMDWTSGKLWIYDQLGNAKIDEMFEAFRYAARRYGVTHFVVDSLAKLGMAEDDYNGQKVAMEALTAFVHEMGVHVHLVAHPRKAEDEHKAPGKMDIRGGAILTDLADNVITVWRNKRKEEAKKRGTGEYQDEGDVRMIISKQRFSGVEESIALWFDPSTCQYLGNPSHKPRGLVQYEGPREQEVA